VKRPQKWSLDKQLLIHPTTYRLGWIHRYICKTLSGDGEIEKFVLKTELMKFTGLMGICLFEESTVFIADDIEQEQKYISVLHEVFHYYFRDYDDSRTRDMRMIDPIEYRAETSAQNMYAWYLLNKNPYEKFLSLYNDIKVEFLTNDEIESIIH
jgi:hypothetical protein